MPRVAHEASVRAPPGTVFRLLTDVEAMPAWLPDLRETELLTDGPLAPGSVVAQRRRTLGRWTRLFLAVAHLDPPREIVFQVTRESQRAGLLTWRVHEAPGGARVEAVREFTVPGLVFLLLPLLTRQYAKELARDVEALRRRAEAG